MDDPKRILDDLEEDPVLRDLVDAGRQVEPTADQLASLAARLPIPGPPGPPGGHGPAGGSARPPPPLVEAASTGLGPAAWVAGAAGIAAVVTLAYFALPTAAPDDTTPPAAGPAALPDAPPDEAVGEGQGPLASPDDTASPGDVAEPGVPGRRRLRRGRNRRIRSAAQEARELRGAAEAPAATPPPDGVEDSRPAEFELLQRARRLVRSSPAAALRLVEEHRELYPTGVLSQEREVISIEALASAGRRAEAERAAQRFSRNYPNSPHRDRIDQALEAP